VVILFCSDSIIHAEIDSRLGEIPNFIKGKVGDIQVGVGKYTVDGESSFLSTVTSNNNISIQPGRPFGINPKQFGKLLIKILVKLLNCQNYRREFLYQGRTNCF
jgi:hypothetical protein